MNTFSNTTVISRLHARKRLYLFAVTAWVVLFASVLVVASYFRGVNLGILVGASFGILLVATLISTIVLDYGSCPRCEQRFVGHVPSIASRLPVSLFRTSCSHCGLSLFTRENEL